MGERAAVISVRDLGIRAGNRRLVRQSAFDLQEGERVLLVGPSGSGKSIVADLLLGFSGPQTPGLDVEGHLTFDGADLLASGPEMRAGRIGAVFQMQRSGLFDDLTIEQNLRFGSADAEARAKIGHTLGIEDHDRAVTLCSGGEQVRIALGRTLLAGGGVILYDEPTTGLDPVNAAQVVACIGEAHSRLSIVITHDYAAFEGWADVVLFLDPVERRLRRLPPGPETFAALHEALVRAEVPQAEAPRAAPSLPARLRAGWRRLAIGTSEVMLDWLGMLLLPRTFLAFVVARRAHALDGPRLRQALRRDLAPGVAAFVGLSAILIALTGTYFLFERLPKRAWSEPIVQDDLVAGLGLIYVRVAIPLLVSVLLAAKLGAAAAAHLGHMARTRQIDALQLLDVPLRRHLLLPTAAGQLASAWVCSLIATGLSYVTCLVVFLASHPGYSVRYFQEAFGRELTGTVFLWVLAKVAVSAVGVAAVAYRIGIQPKQYPRQVVKGIHRTLLAALLLVLGIHAFFAFLEF